MNSRATIFALLALLLVPAVAKAEAPIELSPSARPTHEASPSSAEPITEARMPQVILSLGVRGMVIPSKGYDPYSSNDVLLQSSFSAGLTFFRTSTFSASASLEWDAGGKSAIARGQELDLFVHRLAVPLEARWQPANRFALFVRAAPGGNRLLASAEPSLRARAWSFGTDLSAGAGLMFAKARSARFWLNAELGYSIAFAASMKLTTQPGEDDPPRRYGATMLPDLQLGGGIARLGVAVSF